MAIEIWNGSAWVVSNDPEVYHGGAWTNVQKGEVYTGSGWSVFYLRVTPIAPTITLNSRTSTSITVNVSVPTGTPYKTQVTIWRTGNLPGSNIPASPAVGSISSTFTQTGLSPGVSYTFNAYTKYYDAVTNEEVAQSATTTFTTSTLAVTIQAPTITLNSRTVSSITVNTSLPTGSPYKTQITIYRDTNPFDTQEIPAVPAVGAASGTFTQTSLSVNTSYTFSAYATYYDAATNDIVATSSTTSASFSTLDYLLTVPTTPVNTFRSSNSLTFEADSNANYSRNTSTAYIEFDLFVLSSGTWLYWDTQGSSALTNDDVTRTRNVTFSSLSSGTTYRARARTVYSTIGQNSGYSANSASVSTFTPTKTGYVPLNNATHMNTGASSASASSTAFGYVPAYASDGSALTVWASDPLSSTTSTQTVSLSEIERTSSDITYYWLTKSTLGSIDEVDVDGITTLTTTPIERQRFNSGTSLRVYLRYSSGTNPPFYTGDAVSITNSVDGVNGSPKTVLNRKQLDGRWTYEFLRTSGGTDAGWISDTSTIAGTVANGNQVSNLNTVGFKTATSSSATSATILSSSAGTTPAFSLATVNGSIILRGRTNKGSGTETLTLNFSPNTANSTPRMIGGVDGIRITNDSAGTQTFSIARLLSDGVTWSTFATDVSLAANATDTYHFAGTMSPVVILGINFFSFRITANRVNPGSGGWYSSFKEVLIQYTYNA